MNWIFQMENESKDWLLLWERSAGSWKELQASPIFGLRCLHAGECQFFVNSHHTDLGYRLKMREFFPGQTPWEQHNNNDIG